MSLFTLVPYYCFGTLQQATLHRDETNPYFGKNHTMPTKNKRLFLINLPRQNRPGPHFNPYAKSRSSTVKEAIQRVNARKGKSTSSSQVSSLLKQFEML